MKLTSIAMRNIMRNLRRSLLSGIAIAVSTMSIVLLFAFVQGMIDDMAMNIKSYSTGEIRIRNEAYSEYERYSPLHLTVDWPEKLPILEQTPGVSAFVPRIQFAASAYMNGSNHGLMVMGSDFNYEDGFIDVREILREGRLCEPGKNETIMGAGLANRLHLTIGDKVTLLTNTATRGSNAFTLTIVGIAVFPVGAMNASYTMIPLDRAQYFLHMDSEVQEILVMADDSVKENTLASLIDQSILDHTGVQTEVKTWKQLNDLMTLMDIASYAYYVIAFFFFILGSTVIINTTMMVIFERMREIGTLAAMGMHGKELTRLFFLEGAIIGAIGAAIGVIVGVVITSYFGIIGLDFTDALSGIDMEMSSVLYPRTDYWRVLIIYVYAVATASLATLIPSRRASKIEPVEALRYV